jgi:hypothetical protein
LFDFKIKPLLPKNAKAQPLANYVIGKKAILFVNIASL